MIWGIAWALGFCEISLHLLKDLRIRKEETDLGSYLTWGVLFSPLNIRRKIGEQIAERLMCAAVTFGFVVTHCARSLIT